MTKAKKTGYQTYVVSSEEDAHTQTATLLQWPGVDKRERQGNKNTNPEQQSPKSDAVGILDACTT